MLVLDAVSASASAPVTASSATVPGAGLSLAAVERELAALCHSVGALQNPSSPNGAPGWLATLQQLKVHLFLTASQLLPVWRDLCRDSRTVDRMEVRLDQLRSLVDQTLAAGPEDAMAQARCDVVADELQQHRVRSVVLLRALDAVADPASLKSLAELWTQEGARLLSAQQQGQHPAMDNEDADPVGHPPR